MNFVPLAHLTSSRPKKLSLAPLIKLNQFPFRNWERINFSKACKVSQMSFKNGNRLQIAGIWGGGRSLKCVRDPPAWLVNPLTRITKLNSDPPKNLPRSLNPDFPTFKLLSSTELIEGWSGLTALLFHCKFFGGKEKWHFFPWASLLWNYLWCCVDFFFKKEKYALRMSNLFF